MKKILILISISVLVFNSKAEALQQNLLQESYETIYHVLSFIESHQEIQNFCNKVDENGEVYTGFDKWKKKHKRKLKIVYDLKAMHDQKALYLFADDALKIQQEIERILKRKVSEDIEFITTDASDLKRESLCLRWNDQITWRKHAFFKRIYTDLEFLKKNKSKIERAIEENTDWFYPFNKPE